MVGFIKKILGVFKRDNRGGSGGGSSSSSSSSSNSSSSSTSSPSNSNKTSSSEYDKNSVYIKNKDSSLTKTSRDNIKTKKDYEYKDKIGTTQRMVRR